MPNVTNRVEFVSPERYATDNGPRCACQGTIYIYMVEHGEKDRFWVTGQCCACHRAVFFHFNHLKGEPTIGDVKAGHYSHIAATSPGLEVTI